MIALRREAPNYFVGQLDRATADAFAAAALAGEFGGRVEQRQRPRQLVLRGDLGPAISALLPRLNLHPRAARAVRGAPELRLTWRAAAPAAYLAIGPLRGRDGESGPAGAGEGAPRPPARA